MPRLCCLLFALAPLWADVEIQDSINDVYYRGGRELAGSTTMTVTGNDFAEASRENPVYIAVSLASGAVMADTLVDTNLDDLVLSQPINLAMEPFGQLPQYDVNAPVDAVSIVRWVAGEDTIWLRVQDSSSNWVDNGDGNTDAPGDDQPVSWTFGISARSSALDNEHGDGNLPFNTRSLDPQIPADAVSTLRCVNLSNSSIAMQGIDSLLRYDVVAYGADALNESGLFTPTTPLDIDFPGNFNIARGKDRNVSVTQDPGLNQPGLGSEEPGWMMIRNNIPFSLNSESGSNTLDFNLHSGSKVTFTSLGDAGFAADGGGHLAVEGSALGFAEVNPNSAFTLNDRTLYRELTLTWDAGTQNIDQFELTAHFPLLIPEGTMTSEPTLAWTFELADHDGAADDAPYDGPEQNRRCPASFVEVSGTLNAVQSERADRHIPHITRVDGSFATNLQLINPFESDQGYLISGYDIEGNLLGMLNGSLAAGEHMALQAFALLENTALSHLTLRGLSDIRIGASYKALGDNKAPVHLFETAETGQLWRLDLGNDRLTYDAFALVNLGADSCVVTLHEISPAGDTVQTTELTSSLAPGAKFLHVMVPGEEGSYFLLETSEPTTVTALRGSHDSSFIWENRALPYR